MSISKKQMTATAAIILAGLVAGTSILIAEGGQDNVGGGSSHAAHSDAKAHDDEEHHESGANRSDTGETPHTEASGHRDDEHHGKNGTNEHGDGPEPEHEEAEEAANGHSGEDGHAGEPHQEGEIELTEAQIQAADITLATAQPATVQSAIQLPGEIAFNADRTAHVVPRLSGVVQAVTVNLGEQVKKGQVLAVIASTELSERRSQFAAAQRRLVLAQTTYKREKQLWEERISAEQDYLQAQQDLREAGIAAENAREQLRALGSDAGKPGNFSRLEVRAPFDGMIVEKDITLGETVSADAQIFTLSDLSSVWADITVPAQQLGNMQVGSKASVEATAFDSRAEGTVFYVGSLVGQQTRAATARITLPNPKGVWRPGLFVNVQIFTGETDVPVTVQRAAIHALEDKPVVFVRIDDGFRAQPVVTGRSNGNVVEIVEGLEAGTRYALANSFIIKSELGKGTAAHSH